MRQAGIYSITNKLNQKLYVGSSRDIIKRWQKEHLPLLKKGTHYNVHLQNAWNKYGLTNFTFHIIEECEESNLAEREGYWIEYHQSWHRQHGYNLVRYIDGRIVKYDHEMCDQVVKLFKEGISKNQIAKTLGISRNNVYSHLERSGLHQNSGRGSIVKLTNKAKAVIEKRRQEGATWRQILIENGVSKTQVYRAGVAKDGQYHGDKRSAYRTVTPEILREVDTLRAQGKTCEEIENEVGVSRFALHQHGVRFQRLKGRPQGKMTEDKKMLIAELISAGKSIKDISAITGIPKSTVRKYKP